jgi:hypothetical protein
MARLPLCSCKVLADIHVVRHVAITVCFICSQLTYVVSIICGAL